MDIPDTGTGSGDDTVNFVCKALWRGSECCWEGDDL